MELGPGCAYPNGNVGRASFWVGRLSFQQTSWEESECLVLQSFALFRSFLLLVRRYQKATLLAISSFGLESRKTCSKRFRAAVWRGGRKVSQCSSHQKLLNDSPDCGLPPVLVCVSSISVSLGINAYGVIDSEDA